VTNRDPYREHHAAPRGQGTEQRNSLGPAMATVGRILTEGRRLTPIGIAIALATPPVLIFAALFFTLGKQGLVEVAAAWRQSAAADGALAAEVKELRTEVAKLRGDVTKDIADVKSDLAAYSTRIDDARKDIAIVDQRSSRTCDLASVLNGGRPREDWCGPPGQGTIFFGPALGAITPYHLTAALWPQRQ